MPFTNHQVGSTVLPYFDEQHVDALSKLDHHCLGGYSELIHKAGNDMNSLYMISLAGTAIFGITGALTAIEHRMDLFGVLAIAFLVGNGGGTIRSVILGIPPAWLIDQNFVYASVIPSTILFFILFFKRESTFNKKFTQNVLVLMQNLLLITDALGLGLFSVVGTQIALGQNVSHLSAVIFGMISAVGGGVIRDVMCNQVPLILRHEVYATPALLGGALYIFLIQYMPENAVLFTVISIVALVRLTSVYWHWRMPLIYREPSQNE